MEQAIPYRSGRNWIPAPAAIDGPSSGSCSSGSSGSGGGGGGGGGVRSMVMENPVVVLGRRGCCMCHVVKRLLLGLGVNPTVCEVEEDREEAAAEEELTGVVVNLDGSRARLQLPAVFIGGRHVGGLDRLMAAHISGDLVPNLKEAGALWL